jgi:hypothetical protein
MLPLQNTPPSPLVASLSPHPCLLPGVTGAAEAVTSRRARDDIRVRVPPLVVSKRSSPVDDRGVAERGESE